MSRINTALLVMQVAEYGSRANVVRQDPAVVKAAHEAGVDIARAAKSTFILGTEIRGAWHRSTRRR